MKFTLPKLPQIKVPEFLKPILQPVVDEAITAEASALVATVNTELDTLTQIPVEYREMVKAYIDPKILAFHIKL